VPGTCVIGLQWGDEAKGKLVDLLAPSFNLVVRYQGGANAGHTVVAGDQTYKLHHIPSGILHPQVQNLITPGVVINPSTMIDEIDALEKRGVRCVDNLRVSERAHLVMPWHIVEDRLLNKQHVGNESIGTTLRGIGPCYRDKVGRTHAVRVADLVSQGRDERISEVARQKSAVLAALGASAEDLISIDPGRVCTLAANWAKRLGPMIGDTTYLLLDAGEQDQRVLYEGAQGALLDIDHGTYPFVTSSNTVAGQAAAGSGMGPRGPGYVLGIVKAYTTRVGEGPFAAELDDEVGRHLATVGREVGVNTGRPRRCGWFDAVLVRQSVAINGIAGIALTKLDVLDGLRTLKICVGYEINGKTFDYLPAGMCDQAAARPIRQAVLYRFVPFWRPWRGARSTPCSPPTTSCSNV